jgi:hypothetical protein
MPTISRHERDLERARRAGAAMRAKGGSAMDIALAQIGAAFGESALTNQFKLNVERYLRLGPHHPAARARFGGRAAMLASQKLDGAIKTVERGWREERKAFVIASAFRPRHTALARRVERVAPDAAARANQEDGARI